MSEYKPINRWSELPAGAPRDVPESWSLDFKAEHSANPGEHAKDIAAFANVFGGTILVGVAEKADSYERKLLSIADAKSAARDYEDAARDLLVPAPMLDTVVIPFPGEAGRALVAINVEPFGGQLVGARAPKGSAWYFPMRTAARHTAFLDPVHMMLHSEPKTRRAAILLARIPVSECKLLQVQIIERYEMEILSNKDEILDGELDAIDAETNTVSLRVFLRDRSEIIPFAVPLEDVDAVWKLVGGWAVRLNGGLVFRRNDDGRRMVRYMSRRGSFRGR